MIMHDILVNGKTVQAREKLEMSGTLMKFLDPNPLLDFLYIVFWLRMGRIMVLLRKSTASEDLFANLVDTVYF